VSDRTWTQFKTNQPSFDEVLRARAILERAGEIVRPQQRPTGDIRMVPVSNARQRFTIDRFFSRWVHVVGAGCLLLFLVGFVAVAVSKVEMEPGALISLPVWVVIGLLFYLSRSGSRRRRPGPGEK
jgi:hypothetical protein